MRHSLRLALFCVALSPAVAMANTSAVEKSFNAPERFSGVAPPFMPGQHANLPVQSVPSGYKARGTVGGKAFSISTGTPVAGPSGWQITLGDKPFGVLPPGPRGWGLLTATVTVDQTKVAPSLAAMPTKCGTAAKPDGMTEATLAKLNYAPRVALQAAILFTGEVTAKVDNQVLVAPTQASTSLNYVIWASPDGKFALVRSLGGLNNFGCLVLQGDHLVDEIQKSPLPDKGI